MGASRNNTMRSVLFALAFAGLAAAQLSPHVGDAWESPATEYCWHSEDPAGHKCYEGCATRPFKNKGLAQPGVCNPHLFNKVTSTKNVVQCSDGVTNVKYCAAPLYTVTVTQKTLGENAVEVLAEASVASMFVHQIVTSPGDHCLEITIPGGAGSPFWKANSWKYSAPDRPEWKTGACDHTKWDEVDSTTENYDGYTAAKNTPYAAVSLNKYGIKTATPAPTPIPQEVEELNESGPRQCTSDKDCACSYCQIDAGKKGPYFCHGSVCCKSDKECPGSYCMNSASKTAPFYCH